MQEDSVHREPCDHTERARGKIQKGCTGITCANVAGDVNAGGAVKCTGV